MTFLLNSFARTDLLSRLLDLLQQVIVPDRALDGDDLGAEIDVVCGDAFCFGQSAGHGTRAACTRHLDIELVLVLRGF